MKLQGSTPSVSQGVTSAGRGISWAISCNRILVLVVWKLGRELPFLFRLRRLVGIVGFAKGKARIFPWRCPYVTDGANCRAGARESLPREKLLPMTANARIVIREIRHVGEASLRVPFGRNFVTSTATQTFVLFRRMKKSGVLRDCRSWRLGLRRARRGPPALTSLCRRKTDHASADYDDENCSVLHETRFNREDHRGYRGLRSEPRMSCASLFRPQVRSDLGFISYRSAMVAQSLHISLSDLSRSIT